MDTGAGRRLAVGHANRYGGFRQLSQLARPSIVAVGRGHGPLVRLVGGLLA